MSTSGEKFAMEVPKKSRRVEFRFVTVIVESDSVRPEGWE